MARRIRGARDHAIDASGLPAGFIPLRWRIHIAVVDNDAKARRTQARLNLALERGSTWHVGSLGESGWLRALHGEENFSLLLFSENPEKELLASSIVLFRASRLQP